MSCRHARQTKASARRERIPHRRAASPRTCCVTSSGAPHLVSRLQASCAAPHRNWPWRTCRGRRRSANCHLRRQRCLHPRRWRFWTAPWVVNPRLQRQFNHNSDDDRITNTNTNYNNIGNSGEEEKRNHKDEMAETTKRTNNNNKRDKQNMNKHEGMHRCKRTRFQTRLTLNRNTRTIFRG